MGQPLQLTMRLVLTGSGVCEKKRVVKPELKPLYSRGSIVRAWRGLQACSDDTLSRYVRHVCVIGWCLAFLSASQT